MKILVLNCGSSSLKYQLIDSDTESVLAKGLCERIGIEGSKLKHQPTGKDDVIFNDYMEDHTVAVKMVIDALLDSNHGVVSSAKEINAVGHRVVHGGEYFASSVIITPEVKEAIQKCCELAPLHNPANLIGIDACEKIMPGVPQVAVFDTAFHQTMPERAFLYALPYEYYEKYKIRRYGFHGTSHKFVAQEAAKMINRPLEESKIITCHLGNGGSICAVRNGKSIDTSMGFTPLEGLVMGTRCGDVDPGALEFLAKKENLDFQQIMAILNQESGVLGISKNYSSDFRELKDAEIKYNEKAALAREIFAYKVAKYVGSYAAAMNGVDNLVFTAGVGENDSDIRQEICDYLEFLGITIDEVKNRDQGEAFKISDGTSRVNVLVIRTNEELEIAREAAAVAREVLAG